jgi:hypothetical protein
MAHADNIDSAVAGQWQSKLVNKQGTFDVRWIIQPDGFYQIFMGNPGGSPREVGNLQVSNGKWSLLLT